MTSLNVIILLFVAAAASAVSNLDLDGKPPAHSGDEVTTTSTETPAQPCKESRCHLPDCFCSGTKVPNDLPAESIPQFIMLTFDDSINPNVHK